MKRLMNLSAPLKLNTAMIAKYLMMVPKQNLMVKKKKRMGQSATGYMANKWIWMITNPTNCQKEKNYKRESTKLT